MKNTMIKKRSLVFYSLLALTTGSVQADNQSWFAGWGTAIKNMGTALWGNTSQSPIIKKNKEKIIAAPVVIGGTGLGLLAGWYYWFKKPKVDKLKKELLTAEAGYYNNQKLGTHLASYQESLKEERDALVKPPVVQMRVSLSQAAESTYNQRDAAARNDYARRLSQNKRAQELNNEILEIGQEIDELNSSQAILVPRIQEYKYQLGYKDYMDASTPVLLKDSAVRKTLKDSQAKSRKIHRTKLEELKKQQPKQQIQNDSEEWEEIPVPITRIQSTTTE